MKWLRLDVATTQITWVNESQREWWRLDAVVAGARARGIKVLGVLSQIPVYARPAGTGLNFGPNTDSQRAVFARFSREAAERYRGRIQAWEVWNEPNLTGYWAPAPNASDYVRLLAATTAAIRSADPGAVVVTGGTGGKGRTTDVEARAWIQQVYDNGGRAHFDAVGLHAFTSPLNNNIGEIMLLAQYRAVLDRNGDYTKELWMTETGTTTRGTMSTSEQQSANWLVETLRAWQQVHHRGPAFVYTLNDSGGSDREGYFGLFRTDGSAKPAYWALQNAMVKGV